MSNAQVHYLQYLNAKKLRKDEDCLRKLVAHQNLKSRLEPLAREADQELVIEEMRRWFEETVAMNEGYCTTALTPGN
jgi:hypothetical protein